MAEVVLLMIVAPLAILVGFLRITGMLRRRPRGWRSPADGFRRADDLQSPDRAGVDPSFRAAQDSMNAPGWLRRRP